MKVSPVKSGGIFFENLSKKPSRNLCVQKNNDVNYVNTGVLCPIYFTSEFSKKEPFRRIDPGLPLNNTRGVVFDNIYSIEKISKDRIKVGLIEDGKKLPPVEMPENMYHLTSEQCFKFIRVTGDIKRTETELLRGVYLLDGRNFADFYPKVQTPCGDVDLLTALFKKVSMDDPLTPFEYQSPVLIKIPTIELLKRGDIRVRTQHDYLEFEDALENMQRGKKLAYGVRDLGWERTMEDFKSFVLNKGYYSEEELEFFLFEMEEKLKKGYSLQESEEFRLLNDEAIEYVYTKPIKLDEIPMAQYKRIYNRELFSDNGSTVNIQKLKDVFD